MRYTYFITYALNIIIIFLIIFGFLKLDEFKYLLNHEFTDTGKFVTVTFFFILYIFLIILNLPLTPFMTMYSAALLGVYEAVIYIFFASSIGAYFSLIVNRYFNRREKFIYNKFLKMNLLFKPSIFHIILLKMIPIIPFSWVIIYVSNTNFSSKNFLFAYSIGCLIPITLTAHLGRSIVENNIYLVSIITIVLVSLIICGKILSKYLSKKI